MEINLPNYPVSIQTGFSFDNMPCTSFQVKDCKVQKARLDLLIEYHAQGDPQVQALWDQYNGKFYLVGGKADESVETEKGGLVCFSLAKANRAWISIDLSSLNKASELTILKKNPAMFVFDERADNNWRKIREAMFEPLMKVSLL